MAVIVSENIIDKMRKQEELSQGDIEKWCGYTGQVYLSVKNINKLS